MKLMDLLMLSKPRNKLQELDDKQNYPINKFELKFVFDKK